MSESHFFFGRALRSSSGPARRTTAGWTIAGSSRRAPSLATTIDDEPYEYKNGQEVKNWDKKYIGATRVRYGIEHSMNVLAVKTLTDYVGETESYDYLLNFGFTTLTDADKNSQAKALGVIESLMKRTLGVKDSGHVLPGHGGMLDRFDSVMMAIPAAYIYIELFIRN